ncbi:MAG: hypothetical protein R3D02_02960 [Hyphomicrobiales bacterium]
MAVRHVSLARCGLGAFALIAIVLLPLFVAIIINRTVDLDIDPIHTATTPCLHDPAGCDRAPGR